MRYNPNPILFVLAQLPKTAPGSCSMNAMLRFGSDISGCDLAEEVADFSACLPAIVAEVKKGFSNLGKSVSSAVCEAVEEAEDEAEEAVAKARDAEFSARMAAAKAAKKAAATAPASLEIEVNPLVSHGI
jgi:hypothetical protein